MRLPTACVALLVLLSTPSAPRGLGPATPRPTGPDSRAVYRLARLDPAAENHYATLIRLGLILERLPDGSLLAYLSPAEERKLAAMGIGWREIREPDRPTGTDAAGYHDYDQLTAALQQVAADHPEITRLISAGQTVEGRELWWLLITDNPDTEEDEPGFKYISTMHGDEPVGTELLLRLIDRLTDGYGTDPQATRIVDEVETWIMPMMNPDGHTAGQRFNSRGVDLNRNFPDRIDDPQDVPDGREPETQALMAWQDDHTTVLSANFHTGALVVNYPYDNNETHSNTYTATADDDTMVDLSVDYSEDNPPMYGSSRFDRGITNGADWYAVSGGMQDWNYVYRGDMQVTIELDDQKWPPASRLDGLWNDNRDSMLSYLLRALTGVRGRVTDAETGAPLAARLQIEGRDSHFYTDPEVGDYHRPLPAGDFTLLVEAPGYASARQSFSVTDPRADAVRVDLALTPLDTRLEHAGHRLAEDSDGDGHLEAGEAGRLAVTLRNAGRAATNVSGTLLPLSAWGSSSEGGFWPDLGAGAEAESLPPHPAIAAAADTPPGHKLAFAVQWSTAEGDQGTTDAFFVPVGAPTTEQYPAGGLPLPIQDHSLTSSSLDVTGDREIEEVNVRVDLTHTYIGDLTVTLVAPDGTRVRLHDASGGATADIHTWYDTETPSVDDLGRLAGKASGGTWTLEVEDNATGDEGTLDAWTLEVISRPFEDPIAEVLLRHVSGTAGGSVRVEWWPVGGATSYHVYRSDDPSSAIAFVEATGEDPDPTDTSFTDSDPRSFLCWIISAEGHTGEGLWGHFDR
ncbi:MAG: M14 family zinc carboxypeptidase [Acidobacteriota bacterium]|nr:M14 family zinc carboxypeptidase [Acidobacteriota bacterium]MDQ7088735.1 M14 family zinc carboxypeptidase [Acidobacteriota bacterium]